MAEYQAFNSGSPQMLAERAAAWNGYNGWGRGDTIPQALRDFITNKVYNTTAGPPVPANLSGDDVMNWGRSAGYDVDISDTPWDPSTWIYHNPSGASPYMLQMGQGAFSSPDGRYHISGGNGGWMIDDLSRDANQITNAWYNADGTYNHENRGSKNMTDWQGVLGVIGAAFGMSAIGAAAAGGAAAGAGAADAGAAGAAGSGGAAAGAAEAGSAAGFVGEGAASGVGAWDSALAGAGGGAAAGAGTGAAAGGGGSTAGGFVGEGAASGVPAWDGALANAGSGAAAGTGATTSTGSGFPGEGTTSGVPAWDSAAANAGLGGVPPASGSGGSGSGTGTTGTPPPANPNVTGTGALSGLQNILNGTGSAGDYAGLLTTLLGAYAGSQGQNASTSSTRTMDPRMDSLFYGDLAPRAQGLLGTQLPAAQTAGNQMMTIGSGLLGQTAPTTATNPYLSGVADDMQRRTTDLLGQNNRAIQGNAVAAGGLGGSRQGVAQGVAAGKAADYLQGNVANLYGAAYTGDQNRLLQQKTLGAGLLSQGLDTQFQPLKNTGNLFSPFNGFGTTTNEANAGGGWQGALGGALGASQYARNAGWWQ